MKLSHYINKKNLLLIILLSLLSWFIYDRYLAEPQDFLIESEYRREKMSNGYWDETLVIVVSHPPKTREKTIVFLDLMVEKYFHKQLIENKMDTIYGLLLMKETNKTPINFDASRDIPRKCTEKTRSMNTDYGCLNFEDRLASVTVKPNKEWIYVFLDDDLVIKDGVRCRTVIKKENGILKNNC